MRNATSEARELEAIAADSADFWPLSPITPDDALWAAWQLHRPHLGDGVVMYFRRSNATASSFATRWVGVSDGAQYTLEYRYGYGVDHVEHAVAGSMLLGTGLAVTMERPASSLLVRYRLE